MVGEAPVGATQAAVTRALKEAVVTGLLAAAVFLPLIAFTYEPSMQNTLQLETHGGWFLIIFAIIAGLRFVQILFIVPWLERRPSKPAAPSAPVSTASTLVVRFFVTLAIRHLAL